MRFARPKPKDLPLYVHVWPNVQSKFTWEFEILRALLAERAKAVAPVSRERFRTEPIHAR